MAMTLTSTGASRFTSPKSSVTTSGGQRQLRRLRENTAETRKFQRGEGDLTTSDATR
jgi:hypothetical protein